MVEILFLNEQDVEATCIPMKDVLYQVEEAISAVAIGKAFVPTNIDMELNERTEGKGRIGAHVSYIESINRAAVNGLGEIKQIN